MVRLPLLLALVGLLILVGSGCTPDAPPSDAAMPDAPRCSGDEDCDDGLFCNGAETCTAGVCSAGASPCDDGPCNDSTDACERDCDTEPDADGDGHDSIDCGGDDCDDTDRLRAPGATEICDVADRDEDCDPRTFGVRDADGDDTPDALCCNDAEDDRFCGDDCDDTRRGVSPTSPEVCNGVDDDCDTRIDEGVLETFYLDADGDGFGVTASTMASCAPPAGFSDTPNDCDDAVAAVHPGAADGPPGACNDLNDDCDDGTDEGCECMEPASRSCGYETSPGVFSDTGACAIGTQICAGGAFAECLGAVLPTTETCNGVDDDCDGMDDIAEGLTITCWFDGDNDSFAGSAAAPLERCRDPLRPTVGGCEPGTTNRRPMGAANIDCDDGRASIRPNATEVCGNELNDDCDAFIDEMCSCTGLTFGSVSSTRISMRSGLGPRSVVVGGARFEYTSSTPSVGHLRIYCGTSGYVLVLDAVVRPGTAYFGGVNSPGGPYEIVIRWVGGGYDAMTLDIQVTRA